MIEQSIAKQYGVLPSQQEELKYSDWCKLVSGIMPDTPLGQTAALRQEKNPDVLKTLNPAQRQLRSEWAAFRAQKRRDTPQGSLRENKQMMELEKMIAGLFGR